jgi:hypothetical protein
MTRFLKIILRVLLFLFLTVLTQIGGLVYLITFWTDKFIDKRIVTKNYNRVAKLFSFLLLYFFFTFLIVPILAKPLGRVRLPMVKSHHLRPLNVMTCILNRNYVKPELRDAAFEAAEQMNRKYPGTVINYLDANFPFINKFPLLPHLSHNDGKKLDLSFCYLDVRSGVYSNNAPSWIGYGICEEPLAHEENKTKFCSEKGYWQYNLLRKIVPQRSKSDYAFDNIRTRDLISFMIDQNCIEKIFIEPHLKTRMGFTTDKIRFQGCRAVRHDDHIHVQCR